jgi:hypothetical protein
LPGFNIQSLECVTTGPKYGKIPVLNWAESAFIRLAALRSLGDLRSDWIAVLQKADGDFTSDNQTSNLNHIY